MINFVLARTKNYALVQAQLNQLIQKWLPDGSFTETYETYREGAVNFTLFIDKPADVLMSHGAADKNYMWRKTEDNFFLNHQRRRRLILVPGSFSVKRIHQSKLSSTGLKAEAVGWPRLDKLLDERKDLNFPSEERRVLFAPTHDFHVQENGLVMSSYPEFLPFYEKLGQLFKVQMSSHPRNRSDKTPTSDLLQWANVVISDHGTMVWEALALGKTVIFPSWFLAQRMLNFKKNSAEWHVFEKKLGWHAESFDHLVALIRDPSPITTETQEFLNSYILPASYGKSGKMVADVLMRLDSTVS